MQKSKPQMTAQKKQISLAYDGWRKWRITVKRNNQGRNDGFQSTSYLVCSRQWGRYQTPLYLCIVLNQLAAPLNQVERQGIPSKRECVHGREGSTHVAVVTGAPDGCHDGRRQECYHRNVTGCLWGQRKCASVICRILIFSINSCS